MVPDFVSLQRAEKLQHFPSLPCWQSTVPRAPLGDLCHHTRAPSLLLCLPGCLLQPRLNGKGRERCPTHCNPFLRAPLKFLTCPGTCKWSGVLPWVQLLCSFHAAAGGCKPLDVHPGAVSWCHPRSFKIFTFRSSSVLFPAAQYNSCVLMAGSHTSRLGS